MAIFDKTILIDADPAKVAADVRATKRLSDEVSEPRPNTLMIVKRAGMGLVYLLGIDSASGMTKLRLWVDTLDVVEAAFDGRPLGESLKALSAAQTPIDELLRSQIEKGAADHLAKLKGAALAPAAPAAAPPAAQPRPSGMFIDETPMPAGALPPPNRKSATVMKARTTSAASQNRRTLIRAATASFFFLIVVAIAAIRLLGQVDPTLSTLGFQGSSVGTGADSIMLMVPPPWQQVGNLGSLPECSGVRCAVSVRYSDIRITVWASNDDRRAASDANYTCGDPAQTDLGGLDGTAVTCTAPSGEIARYYFVSGENERYTARISYPSQAVREQHADDVRLLLDFFRFV